MVIDWRADHSFRVPRPDLTPVTGAPNACTQGGCHDDKPLSWSIDAYRRWYGEARKSHFGTTFVAARRGDPAARPELLRLAQSGLVAPIVRATGLELLSTSPDAEAVAALRAALGADEALLRRTAAANLPLSGPEDVERLAPLLSDPVRAVRMSAVSQLAPVPRDLLKPYQQEALERGVAEYRASMAYSLDFAASAFNLGNLEVALGDEGAAERYYRQALRIDALFRPARANLVVLLSRQGRNAEAEGLLREGLRAQPDDADAMISLGLLRTEMGDLEEGLAWLDRAAELRPRDARVRRNLGLLLQRMGRLDEAEEALRRAYELDPTSLEVMHAWADHLLRRGRREEAREVVRRILEVHPDSPLGPRLEAATRP
jgi:tetratricopeptide (TPR) repeat protein